MRSKTKIGRSNRKVENKFSFGLLSVNEIFRLDHRQEATSVLFIFYTRCCIRPNRSRSHGVSMNPRCDTAVSDENEKCWKTDNFLIFCHFCIEL